MLQVRVLVFSALFIQIHLQWSRSMHESITDLTLHSNNIGQQLLLYHFFLAAVLSVLFVGLQTAITQWC